MSVIMRIRVVLPAPLGPSRAKISPGWTSNDTWLTTARPSYRLVQLRTSSMGPSDGGGGAEPRRTPAAAQAAPARRPGKRREAHKIGMLARRGPADAAQVSLPQRPGMALDLLFYWRRMTTSTPIRPPWALSLSLLLALAAVAGGCSKSVKPVVIPPLSKVVVTPPT